MATPYLRLLGKFIIEYRSKRRYAITKNNLTQYVPLDEWNENIEKFLAKGKGKVIFVNIPCPGERLLSRNYSLNQIVTNYNSSILEIAKKYNTKVVDFYSITKDAPNLLLDDGYHITIEAHKLLGQKLFELVNNG